MESREYAVLSIEALRKARNEIKNTGVAPNETLGQRYIEAIAEVKKRMCAAKVTAMREAEKPFLDEVRELEEDYAIFLKMAS